MRKAWETKRSPWWHTEKDYDEYNEKQVVFYKNYSGVSLTKEWEKWQNEVQKEIDSIGEENLRSHPNLFAWLFDESATSHYGNHLEQIKRALQR